MPIRLSSIVSPSSVTISWLTYIFRKNYGRRKNYYLRDDSICNEPTAVYSNKNVHCGTYRTVFRSNNLIFKEKDNGP